MNGCNRTEKVGKYMAMLQLGKLKFRFKDGGLDFRWGEGKKMRIGKKSPVEQVDDYADDYMDYDGDADLNYDGRFADDQDYPDDDYADYEDEPDYGGYSDEDDYDDGYDDSYDSDGYDDDEYGDGQYDDSYDSYDGGYDDDGYDEEYDDRYYDDDAADGYADEDYDDYDDGYGGYDDGYEGYDDGYDDGYPEGGFGALLQYVDENDWVTYLLLVLLPPLGIYLLWRRQRFEPMMRYAVSAVSAVWFVVMIVLLATMILKGSDSTNQPPVPTLGPTAVVNTAASPSPTATVQPGATAVAPAATPIGGGTVANPVSGTTVWASGSGNFYHKAASCSLASGENLAQTTLENAKNRGKYACPTCYGGTLYYATSGGKYYHLDSDCSNMGNAEMYTKEMAEVEKKSACPVCVTKTQKSLDKVSGNVTMINTGTKDKSGIKVWCTNGGVNYHMTKNCRGMSGAKQVTLSEALLKGKTACKTCCAVSGNTVYCTKGGTYYHRNSTCSGMSGASKVTVAEALVLGKKECPSCRPVANSSTGSSSSSRNDSSSVNSSGSTGSDNSSGSTSNSGSSSSDSYYVYATSGGKYYHVKQKCSGMSGAKRVTLKSMLDEGREACPECCGGAAMSVYATKGGTYYHSYATCSDMSNATKGSLAQALALGYKRCPRCWGSTGSTASTSTTNQSASSTQSGSSSQSGGASAATATGKNVMVYATKNGKWYHTKSNCSGMKNASQITLNQAIAAGKTACATCAATAKKTVYSTNSGKYYHKASTCDNMKGATKRTLAEALQKGQTACPVCLLTSSGTGSGSTSTVKKMASYSVGKSGIKVYASPTQKYYHTQKNCSGISGLSHVALETALNYGRTACPKCADTASEKVYATKNGKYYHISRSCAGGGASSGTLASALAYGFSPCPYCVTGTKTNSPNKVSNTYESGRSGVKVYATASGKYYHTKKSCAGSGAVKVTLETALNYGKRACSECCAVADRTVYAVEGYFYYHASKSCAGSNAVKGNYAQALAYGLKACPNCIGGGSSSAGTSTKPSPTAGPTYSAPANTAVYIDLYSDQFYYHKASKCSGSGMSGGTEVTLEYAKDFGYKRCPYCSPASSVG